MCVCVCVCVCLWPPVSIPLPNYEVVGLQAQSVDITDLGSVHPSSKFSSPPTSKMHASDETIKTKDGKWVHLWPPVWSIRPNQQHRHYVLILFFNPNKLQTTMTRDEIYKLQHFCVPVYILYFLCCINVLYACCICCVA